MNIYIHPNTPRPPTNTPTHTNIILNILTVSNVPTYLKVTYILIQIILNCLKFKKSSSNKYLQHDANI